MLAIPYSAALRLNKIPYVTLAVTLLCMLVFYLQITNQHKVGQSLSGYCDSIYRPDQTQASLDFLRRDAGNCYGLLGNLHQRSSHHALSYLEHEYRTGVDNDIDPGDVPEIMRLLQEHLDEFQQQAPADLDGQLMHFPDEWWNPLAMLTSSVAHADWGHIIFNLIFFLAFAPAVEVLINNTLKFSAVIVGIALITGISYSLTVLISGQPPVPTLGLSGVVTGMIGLSAYLMPHARIRVFVWFIAIVRSYYIPAWILASWYIGWDIWAMLTTDEHGGVNLIAHVSGGIAGYLIGLFWLKTQRDDVQDDLEEEIEYMRARRDFSGTMATYKGGRRELQNIQREKKSQRDHDGFMAELYRYVKTDRDSDAIALILSDYEFQSASIEIFEQLFERVKEWGASRMLMCLGRLLINLLIEQRKYARALMYIEQCQQVSAAFLLADPANVLLMASMARDNHQYEVAYQLVREAETRYGEAIDLTESSLIEVELLWQHLNRQDSAKERMKQLLSVNGMASNKQFMNLAKQMI